MHLQQQLFSPVGKTANHVTVYGKSCHRASKYVRSLLSQVSLSLKLSSNAPKCYREGYSDRFNRGLPSKVHLHQDQANLQKLAKRKKQYLERVPTFVSTNRETS